MKSGVYDGATDSHKLMDQAMTREDIAHAWYDEPGGVHPFERYTNPVDKNDIDPVGNIHGQPQCATLKMAIIGPLHGSCRRGSHGQSWQHTDPLILDMYRKMGSPSITLRHFARMHELCKSIAKRNVC